jgi:hypothetical protein
MAMQATTKDKKSRNSNKVNVDAIRNSNKSLRAVLNSLNEGTQKSIMIIEEKRVSKKP